MTIGKSHAIPLNSWTEFLKSKPYETFQWYGDMEPTYYEWTNDWLDCQVQTLIHFEACLTGQAKLWTHRVAQHFISIRHSTQFVAPLFTVVRGVVSQWAQAKKKPLCLENAKHLQDANRIGPAKCCIYSTHKTSRYQTMTVQARTGSVIFLP